METNAQLELARKIVEETGTSLFLTGKAGTGKTTFLRDLRKSSSKRMVVLAPTGIAALNAGGVTIHSFFQLPFGPHVPGAASTDQRFKVNEQKRKLIRTLELIVIDEISMVRADLLDAVDDALRRLRHCPDPFGGVQMLLIGDLQQLSPVAKDEEWALLRNHYASPYFFDSQVLRRCEFATVELTRVYRQSDAHFLDLLNRVRSGDASPDTLSALNSRYVPGFVPKKEDGYIRLVTHNRQADAANDSELAKLRTQAFRYKARVEGDFPSSSYPADEEIELKAGAQVMFVKNATDHRYVNGSLATVVSLSRNIVTVKLKGEPEAKTIEVAADRWENTRYELNKKTGEIEEKTVGSFSQIPLRLAWAVTIHKSQGLTFSRVMIDASAAFTHGQTYVALSRCRTLEGIVLSAPIPASAVIADKRVLEFTESQRERSLDEESLTGMRSRYAASLLMRLFTFEAERVTMAALARLLQEHVAAALPETARRWEDALARFDLNVMGVAGTFHRQIERLLSENGGDTAAPLLQERVRKGAQYFRDALREVQALCGTLSFAADSKVFAKSRDKHADDLSRTLRVHAPLLEKVASEGFEPKEYIAARTRLMLEAEAGSKDSTKKAKVAIPAEVQNAEVYAALVSWRRNTAEENGLPPFAVFSNRALIGIANLLPATRRDLLALPDIGKAKATRYGAEVLEIVAGHTGACSDEEAGSPVGSADVPYLQEKNEAESGTKKEGKTKKTASDLVTLELYRKGMGIADIAAARALAESTVVSHLAAHVATGEAKVERLVPAAHIATVRRVLAGMSPDSLPRLSEIRAAAGEDIPYAEIHLVLADWKREKSVH